MGRCPFCGLQKKSGRCVCPGEGVWLAVVLRDSDLLLSQKMESQKGCFSQPLAAVASSISGELSTQKPSCKQQKLWLVTPITDESGRVHFIKFHRRHLGQVPGRGPPVSAVGQLSRSKVARCLSAPARLNSGDSDLMCQQPEVITL